MRLEGEPGPAAPRGRRAVRGDGAALPARALRPVPARLLRALDAHRRGGRRLGDRRRARRRRDARRAAAAQRLTSSALIRPSLTMLSTEQRAWQATCSYTLPSPSQRYVLILAHLTHATDSAWLLGLTGHLPNPQER